MEEKLQRELNELRSTVYNHKHRGFDFTKELESGSVVYSGKVNGDGSALNLPTGWTSSKLGTGTYEVQHTLGTADFTPIAISYATTVFCKLNGVSDTATSFVFIDHAGNATDVNSFYFLITLF